MSKRRALYAVVIVAGLALVVSGGPFAQDVQETQIQKSEDLRRDLPADQ